MLEDIRLTPEEIQAICDELVNQPDGLILNDFLKEKFDAATDKAIKKIVEYLEQYHTFAPFKGFSLYMTEDEWQVLKDMVKES